MANFNEIARKKVAGVPVIYLAGAAVIILAIVAWKLKPSTSGAGDSGDGTDTTGDAKAPTANPYDSLNPDGDGTVTVQQLGPAANTDAVVKTNDDWVKEGAVWLEQNKDVSGTDALAALNAYINGQDRTFDQNNWVNAWIKQDGPPPDGVAEGGSVGNKPAVRQIPTLPGYHTVQGNTDDSYGELSVLYYGQSNQANIDLLQAANTSLPPNGPFAVGTRVFIPAYHNPQYYTTPRAMTSAQIGSANGISVQQIAVLNNTSRSSWPKGAKVRVK